MAENHEAAVGATMTMMVISICLSRMSLDKTNFLYRNNGSGNFVKITSGPVVNDGGDSHGSSWGDFDNDGDLDLFVANAGENNFLYLNHGNSNNWVNIELLGTASNNSAIGAKVKVKATIQSQPVWQMRELSGQTGYLSQNSLNAEFGLGDAAHDRFDSHRMVRRFCAGHH